MVATCQFCSKEFSKNSNLNRHLKEKHRPHEDTEPSKNFTCVLCDKTFIRREHLTAHINAVHFQGKQLQCNKCNFKTFNKRSFTRHCNNHEARPTKSTLGTRGTSKKYHCTKCLKQYKKETNLNYHMREKHGCKKQAELNKKKCPLCNFTASHTVAKWTRKSMLEHFEKKHDLNMDFEEFEFGSMDEFNKWKRLIESESFTEYRVKRISEKNLRFICHRSGYFTSKGSGKRSMKISGTCKINGFCPASMTVKIKDSGQVKVIFQKSHVGHKNEPKHVLLTKSEKEKIAASIANKIPYEEILRSIRRDVTDGNLSRLHLTTRKDIANIARSFNLRDESHCYDPVSVQVWVDQFKVNNEEGVLFFKPQGVADTSLGLSEMDFVLIFMTDTQKDMFTKYGSDVVCVDGTHGVNAYNFQLYTALVLDDTREGVPICFMVSNRGDQKIMELFFKQIRNSVGTISAKVFMSDMEESFYSAWKCVMGAASMQLFCTWHVLKAWRKNIQCKIKEKDKRDQTYSILRALLCETDPNAFKKMLSETLCKWKEDIEMKEFLEYFEQYYVSNSRFEKWAYCCRIGAGVNTNMALENFNKLLKYCYLRGKTVKRLDRTLCAVLNLIRDKLFDLLIKSYKGKVVSKLKILRKRHKESLRLNPENALNEGEGHWKVLSSSLKEFYTVKRRNKNCQNCLLKCHHCKTCFHEYSCSCLDNGIKNNMCKHIHIVAKLEKGQTDSDGWIAQVEESNVEEDTNFLNSILNGVSKKSTKCSTNLFAEKEKFLLELTTIINEKVTNFEELEAVERHCKSIGPILDAIKAAPASSSSVPHIVDKTPANRKVIPQRKFLTTKKSRKIKKEVLHKPTREDQDVIAVKLLMDNKSRIRVSKLTLKPRLHEASRRAGYLEQVT
jgi:hypothetical protein